MKRYTNDFLQEESKRDTFQAGQLIIFFDPSVIGKENTKEIELTDEEKKSVAEKSIYAMGAGSNDDKMTRIAKLHTLIETKKVTTVEQACKELSVSANTLASYLIYLGESLWDNRNMKVLGMKRSKNQIIRYFDSDPYYNTEAKEITESQYRKLIADHLGV